MFAHSVTRSSPDVSRRNFSMVCTTLRACGYIGSPGIEGSHAPARRSFLFVFYILVFSILAVVLVGGVIATARRRRRERDDEW